MVKSLAYSNKLFDFAPEMVRTSSQGRWPAEDGEHAVLLSEGEGAGQVFSIHEG